jgi:hypothetical protein
MEVISHPTCVFIGYNFIYHKEGVAQLAEQWTVDPRVAGSSPVTLPTNKGGAHGSPFYF